jgi:hypothetical protein
MYAVAMLAVHGGPGVQLVVGLLTILALIWGLVEASRKQQNVNWRNGLPYCPRCNRQVSLKMSRPYCRSCGYNLVQPPQRVTPPELTEPPVLPSAQLQRVLERKALREALERQQHHERMKREQEQAELQRQRRQQWCKKNESIIVGLGLPVAVLFLISLVILVLHTLSSHL